MFFLCVGIINKLDILLCTTYISFKIHKSEKKPLNLSWQVITSYLEENLSPIELIFTNLSTIMIFLVCVFKTSLANICMKGKLLWSMRHIKYISRCLHVSKFLYCNKLKYFPHISPVYFRFWFIDILNAVWYSFILWFWQVDRGSRLHGKARPGVSCPDSFSGKLNHNMCPISVSTAQILQHTSVWFYDSVTVPAIAMTFLSLSDLGLPCEYKWSIQRYTLGLYLSIPTWKMVLLTVTTVLSGWMW